MTASDNTLPGDVLEIDTPHGPARAYVSAAAKASAALVLGHGAGGGVSAPDLTDAAGAAASLGWNVALVEQPYRVAGRRSPAPAHHLDAAWTAICAHLASGPFSGLSLVTGGRSSGARVACRTAAASGADAVLCLAFALQPPARKSGTTSPSRIDELEAVEVPVLVVQGTGDRFGMPPPGPRRKVIEVRGDHSLRSDRDAVRDAIADWLPSIA